MDLYAVHRRADIQFQEDERFLFLSVDAFLFLEPFGLLEGGKGVNGEGVIRLDEERVIREGENRDDCGRVCLGTAGIFHGASFIAISILTRWQD
jgi:hypothetical protein